MNYECDCGKTFDYPDGPIICADNNHGVALIEESIVDDGQPYRDLLLEILVAAYVVEEGYPATGPEIVCAADEYLRQLRGES